MIYQVMSTQPESRLGFTAAGKCLGNKNFLYLVNF
jgi:hypothetical protein